MNTYLNLEISNRHQMVLNLFDIKGVNRYYLKPFQAKSLMLQLSKAKDFLEKIRLGDCHYCSAPYFVGDTVINVKWENELLFLHLNCLLKVLKHLGVSSELLIIEDFTNESLAKVEVPNFGDRNICRLFELKIFKSEKGGPKTVLLIKNAFSLFPKKVFVLKFYEVILMINDIKKAIEKISSDTK